MPFGQLMTHIEARLSQPRLRLLKTGYVNLRCLPIRQAIHLPIKIYGRFAIHALGEIRIESPRIVSGMIKFGKFNNKSARPTRVANHGTIIFKGHVDIWEGVLLELGFGARLEIGDDVILGENLNIMLRKSCTIGDHCRIAFDTQIMDSDFHYMVNMETGVIKDCSAPVEIGSYNWIGNKTTIKKGTKTPDYTIVAGSNSLLSKDYKELGGGLSYIVLAGCPAKIIGSGVRRIFNFEWEHILAEHFKKTSEPYIYKDNGIDPFSIPK